MAQHQLGSLITVLSLPAHVLPVLCVGQGWEGGTPAPQDTPMSSAKPPTGRRQVPVTNCSSRILFSLSISLTTCSRNTAAQCDPGPILQDGSCQGTPCPQLSSH